MLLFEQKEERFYTFFILNDISTKANLGAILNLTPHRSAELLFGQKEERSAYIADNQ